MGNNPSTKRVEDIDPSELDLFDRKSVKVENVDHNLFDVDFKDIEVLSITKGESSGKSANFYKAKYQGNEVLLKVYKSKDITSENELSESFKMELEIIKKLKHKNLFEFMGASLDEDKTRVAILLESCENGDVKTFIQEKKNERLSTPKKLEILHGVASAMSYVNKNKIIHRDLRFDHVFLTKDLIPKLLDSGLSVSSENPPKMNKENKDDKRTNEHMSPEMSKDEAYTCKTDVFSFGIMIFELLTENFHPYGKFPEFNVGAKVSVDESFRPKIEKSKISKIECLEWIVEIMENSWNADPDKRPSFDEIVNSIEENIDETREKITEFDKLEKEEFEKTRERLEKLKSEDD